MAPQVLKCCTREGLLTQDCNGTAPGGSLGAEVAVGATGKVITYHTLMKSTLSLR